MLISRYLFLLVTLSLSIWSSTALAGQLPERRLSQYLIRTWDESDGLPFEGIRAVAQSTDGFVWVGTEMGLVRFDGSRFETSRLAGLPSLEGYVWKMSEDEAGYLWVAMGGKGILRYRDGVFTRFPGAEFLSSIPINSVLGDGAGGAWVGTEGSGLYWVSEDTVLSFGESEGLPSASVRALAHSRDGGLWVGTRGSGLLKLVDGRVRPVVGAEILSDQEILAVVEDGGGTVWMATRGGLFRLLRDDLQRFSPESGAPEDPVLSFALSDTGDLWMGTLGGGLFLYRAEEFQRLTAENGLPEDDLRSVALGERGDVWVGSRTRGLAALQLGEIVPLTEQEGLSERVVLPILEAREGGMWIGTFGGGVDRVTAGEIDNYAAAQGLTDPFVLSLAEDLDGALWVGTRSALFKLSAGRFRRVLPRAGDPPFSALSLHVDREGDVWAGGPTGLLRIGAEETDRYGTDTGLSNAFIYTIFEARDGTIWLGTNGGGLNGLREGEVRVIDIEDGLPSSVVLSLHQDAGGTLWVGTTGGLSRIRGEDIRTLSRQEGLLDNAIFRILEDDDGFFWMTTNRGIFRLSADQLNRAMDDPSETLDARVFNTSHGMPSREANGGIQPAGWKAGDGRMWFPTVAGVAIVDPGRLNETADNGVVLIERIVVDEEGLPVFGGDSLSFGPGVDRLTIQFTLPDFRSPESLRFQHALEGPEGSWQDSGPDRRVSYTNLSPGTYRFSVRAGRQGTAWSDQVASLEFRVLPRFHQTWWFFLLILAAGFTLLYGVDRLRHRLVVARERKLWELNRRLEVKVATRTLELEAINKELEAFSSSVSHDLQGPLRGIDTLVEFLLSDHADELPGDARRLAEDIRTRARQMARLINDLLAFSRAARKSIRFTEIKPGWLVTAVFDELRRDAGERSIRLELGDLPPLYGDENLIRQVWINLISNAIKFSQTRAEAVIEIACTKGEMENTFLVRDNGVGFNPDQAEKMFETFVRLVGEDEFPGTGIGLALVRRIISRHGGRIWAEGRPNEGATIFFTLPAEPPASSSNDAE